MLYNMLSLIREKDDGSKLNLARFAYLISRMSPENKDNIEMTERFSNFRRKIYGWINNNEDRRQLVTAIYLYVYSIRDSERNEE